MFKVINILEQPNERYAECIVLIDGYKSNCWIQYGIQFMTLGLWTSNQHRTMASKPDMKMIDFYNEVTESEFVRIFAEYEQAIRKDI